MTWLKEVTNRDEAYWVARVQQLIADATTPDGKGHGETDTDWLKKLVDEVIENLPSSGQPYDGNMRSAAILGMILTLWYANTHLAKTRDSRRPTYERQVAAQARLRWATELVRILLDDTGLPTYYPGQPWQFCWAPDARGGDFL